MVEMRATSGMLVMLVLAVLQQGCSTTATVVATLDGYDELMVGRVQQSTWSGGGRFSVDGKNSGLSCQGVALPPYAVANNLSLSCAGQVGRGNAECSDGRTVEFKWVADSCSRFHGEGEDSVGNSFYFVSGMDEAEAGAYIEQKLVDASGKPGLAVYSKAGSGETGGIATGTGFYVTDNGVMITSWHVVEGADSIHVLDVEHDTELPARLLATDPGNDIAVIATDVKSVAIPLADQFIPVKGDEVLALGYPLPGERAQDKKVTFGRISSPGGLEGGDRMLQVDVPIQPGNAGGPVLNGKGEVIGMVTTSLEEVLRARANGSLPPNISLAITIDYLLPALQRSITGAGPAPGAETTEMDLARIVELRGPSVMLVVVDRSP